jgi:hypothetical protein
LPRIMNCLKPLNILPLLYCGDDTRKLPASFH